MIKTEAKYLSKLKEKTFHKLIIGAALKDYKTIEDFSYYFTHAGADVLDISAFPHSVLCTRKGIEKALLEDSSLTEPLIMISVNIGEDPHFRRIELNWDNCTECLACVPTCPSTAFRAEGSGLSLDDDRALNPEPRAKFSYNENLCFGCSNCLPSCNFDALKFETWDAFKTESLIELQELGARAIEIHLNNDLEAFRTFYLNMPKFELESFCIGSDKMTREDLEAATEAVIEVITKKDECNAADGTFQSGYFIRTEAKTRELAPDDELRENQVLPVVSTGNDKFCEQNSVCLHPSKQNLRQNFIIQTDGIPMSGARDMGDIEKDLVSMENAKVVKEYIKKHYPKLEKKIFVQLAGGITEASLAKAKKRKLDINGVAIGSYARKVLDQSETPIETAKELINKSLSA